MMRWDELPGRLRDVSGDEERQVEALPISPAIEAVLATQPHVHPWVFTNSRTEKPFTVNGARHVFDRAVRRAGIKPSSVDS